MAFGFFAIILAQTVAASFGESAPIQNALLGFFGGAGYVVIGILHMAFYKDHKRSTKLRVGESFYAMAVTNGALAVANGLVMMADALHSVYLIARAKDFEIA